MQLNQEEFVVLWNIECSSQTSPERAAEGSGNTKEKYEHIFGKLCEIGLISAQKKDNTFYGALVNENGRKVLKDKKYLDWIPD